MKLKLITLALAFATFGAQAAVAHPDHDHGPKRAPTPAKPATIDEAAAKVRGQEEVARLVTVKKIDASWKDSARLGTIKKSSDARNWEWVLTFDNDKVKKNKRLFIFLKPSGAFVAANFTGR